MILLRRVAPYRKCVFYNSFKGCMGSGLWGPGEKLGTWVGGLPGLLPVASSRCLESVVSQILASPARWALEFTWPLSHF